MIKQLALILTTTLLLSSYAIAVDTAATGTAAAAGAKAPHKQSLSFEDELVEGSTQKPELFYLFQKKNFNYKRLIKMRENFLPEMKRNAEDIQRGRSNN